MTAEVPSTITSDETAPPMENVPAQLTPNRKVSAKAARQGKAPRPFDDDAGLFKTVCRSFMQKKKCVRAGCRYVHDKALCQFFWRSGDCRFGDKCRKNHFVTRRESDAEEKAKRAGSAALNGEEQGKKKKPTNMEEKKKEKTHTVVGKDMTKMMKDMQMTSGRKSSDDDKKSTSEAAKDQESSSSTSREAEADTVDKHDKQKEKETKTKTKKKKKSHDRRQTSKKNTESFEPMIKPVDLRITFDLGSKDAQFSTPLTSRDVVLVPNLFSDYKKGELYAKLMHELDHCGIPREQLLKMWHGNDKIDGTHLIVDDRSSWKAKCPTFDLVTDRLKRFFHLDIKATRFNWYKDTSQWKPFHFDAAAVKPHLATIQNFTVGVSFGATRDAAFEHATTKTVVSVPQPDGCVYAFSRDTNVLWRHGILHDVPVRDEGRISVIAWGWVDNMADVASPAVPTA